MSALETSHGPRWKLEDIDFDRVDATSIKNDEFLFYLLVSASIVEILSDKYSANLIEHFDGNEEVTNWLRESWQVEEVQHGRTLRAYVQKVWPEFDWQAAHDGFWGEYAPLCQSDQLEPHRGLELVARCVVETGTSTFYRALFSYVNEPVLRQILTNIRTDEASHYAHFRRYFQTYNAIEKHGFFAVIGAIIRRMKEVQGEDGYIAFKHVYLLRNPGKRFDEAEWVRYNKAIKHHARDHYPYEMAVKMLVKPIPMRESLRRWLELPLIGIAKLSAMT
jgi:hypothetical protein